MVEEAVKANVKTKQRSRVAEWAAIGALLSTIALFHALTIRSGHTWGDDFALYIHHGENIAHHQPYAATGYIYNLREAYYGPRNYPPVFPLLLAPVIELRGLDFKAMKLEQVAALTLALATLYLLFRRDLELPYRLLLIAVLGFNPLIWEAKDSVLSDFPFWLFFLLAALLMERSPRSGRDVLMGGVLTGTIIYLAIGTRSIGVVLLPGLALYEVFRVRRLNLFAPVALVTAAVLIVLQHLAVPAQEGSYAEQFHSGLSVIASNLHDYASVLATFWPPTGGRAVSYLVFAAMTALAVFGGTVRFQRRGLLPIECAMLFYVLAIAIWPGNQGFRFLLPIVSLYLGCAIVGLSALAERWGSAWPRNALVVFAIVVSALYAGDYRKHNFGAIQEANGLATYNDLSRFIRQSTDSNDVFLFYRARLLSLSTDRPASVYFLDGKPIQQDWDDQWQYLRRIGTRYVVASDLFEPDRTFLQPLLAAHRQELRPVYHNKDFVMYQVAKPNE